MAVLDGPEGLTDSVCGGCAGSNDRKARSTCIVPDRYISCRYVSDHGRDEKRRHPFGAFGQNLLRLPDHSGEASDSRADIHSESERIYISILSRTDARLLHGLPCSCHRIYGELVLLSCKTRLDSVIRRIEILHFTCNLYRKVVSGKSLHEIYSANPVKKAVPICPDIVSYRSYDSHSRYNYSSVHI